MCRIGLTTQDEGGMVALPIDAITAMELEVVGSLGNPHSQYEGLLAFVAQGKLNPECNKIGGINRLSCLNWG